MLSRLLSYAMVLATLAVGVIPAGWMPAFGDDGKVLLVICTTDGIEEAWVDLGDNAPAPGSTDQMDDRSCPFSALTASAVLPQDAAAHAREPSMTVRWAQEAFTHYSAGFHWRYDARGPPSFS